MTNPLVSVRHMIPLHFKTHNLINSYVVSATRTPSFSLHPIKRLLRRVNFGNSAPMLLPAAHRSAHFTTHSLVAKVLCFTDATSLPCQPCCICDEHTSHYLNQMAKIPLSPFITHLVLSAVSLHLGTAIFALVGCIYFLFISTYN